MDGEPIPGCSIYVMMVKDRNVQQDAPAKESLGVEKVSKDMERNNEDEDTQDEMALVMKPRAVEL